MERPRSGQRWISLSEPELGLGEVREVSNDAVQVQFPAAREMRRYALASAPLRRAVFPLGEVLRDRAGTTLVVESITHEAHLLRYHGQERSLCETTLADDLGFHTAEAKWRAGILDESSLFSLRLEAWYRRGQMQQSPVRGLVGGRVDLIPHQLSVAMMVGERLVPRALLADEVGLGKTVEAGLILHRLHLTGRADRVLVLVPESLLHQWFVEMLRKFNLNFNLYDEARCEAVENSDELRNPFLESPLILAAVDLLAHDSHRLQQAAEAGWDLLIVDEAHHLGWEDGVPGLAYAAVAKLAEDTPGLLLLTATPEQLSEEGHHARLRLLDPERYQNIGKYRNEMDRYAAVAEAVERLRNGQWLTGKQHQLFAQESTRVRQLVTHGESSRAELIAALLDGFGLGRVMFRHTRKQLSGFPVRKAHLVALDQDGVDSKITWLVALLKKLGAAKVLLICSSRPLAEDIFHRLQAVSRINAGLFHEGLTLIQRDRAAAYFAEPEGARMLICSEIGSEGRNFQFAHHLVLFDLPTNPELLEQRIGRLDRIGQSETIHLHIPYALGTTEEVWARWYHQGLNAFEQTVPGAAQLMRNLHPEQVALDELDSLIRESRQLRDHLVKTLAKGQDRLLALNSGGPEVAATLIGQICALDAEVAFEKFFLRVLAHYGMSIEPLGARTYVLHPGHLQTAAFPAMPTDGLTATFDRKQALSREDWAFLSGDHPLVRGALDLLLTSEQGNAAFAIWEDSDRRGMLVEVCFILECLAPASLQADRFLAPRPLRIVVDHTLADVSKDRAIIQAQLQDADAALVRTLIPTITPHLPTLLEKAQELAETQRQRILRSALGKMRQHLQQEITRQADLSPFPQAAVDTLQGQQEELTHTLNHARLRLDALRVIFCGAPTRS